MTDAAFIWSTNIGEVAAQIEKGLGAIRASVGRGVGGSGAANPLGGTKGGLFDQGIHQRIRAITNQLDADLGRAAKRYEEGMARAVKKGTPFTGVQAAVGTKGTTTDFRQLAEPLVKKSLRDLNTLGRDIGQVLTGPLEGVRPEVSKHLGSVAESIRRQTSEQVERFQQQKISPAGIPVAPGDLSAQRSAERAAAAAASAAVTSVPTTANPAAVDTAMGSILAAAKGDQQDARNELQRMQRSRIEADGQLETARRVVDEIKANTSPTGTSIDPRGARRDGGGVLIDSAGKRYVQATDPESGASTGGLVEQSRRGGPLGDLNKAVDQWRESADDQKRNALEARASNQQAAREGKEIRDIERQSLAGRLLADRENLVTGGKSGYVRTPAGEMYKYGASGAEQVRTPADRQAAEQAFTEQLRKRAKLEEQAYTEDAKRTRDRRRQENLITQQRAVVGAGGAARGGGGGGSFGDRFWGAAAGQSGRGFRMEDIFSSGFSFARYMVSAAVIGGAIAALSQVKDSVVDYRDSLTDLEIALRSTEPVSQAFIGDLSDIARVAGANTGDAIDAAVRGIRAFRDLEDESGETYLGTQFADTASQLAVIAEKDLRDATGDLVAIASAFDLSEESFSRVTDSIAVAKRELGGSASEIAQGLAAVGPSAAEAGFMLEETANLISLVQARTDQSGRAVATRFSRIFSIIGGSQGRSAIESLNRQLNPELRIDSTASVRDQLLQISEIYGQLSAQQQGLVRNALGGAANTRELIPILNEPEALAAALDAQFDGAGKGLDEFARKAGDLVGILRKIRGDIEGIFTGLFELGVFDVFGAAVKYGVEPFLNAIRELVNATNSLVGWFRQLNVFTDFLGGATTSALIFAGQMTLVIKLVERLRKVQLLSGVTLGDRMDAYNRRLGRPMGRIDQSVFPQGSFAEQMGRQAPGRAGVIHGRQVFSLADISRTQRAGLALTNLAAGVGRLATTLRNFIVANPLLVVAGGFMAISSALSTTKQVLESAEAIRGVLNQQVDLVDPSAIRNHAQDLLSAAEEADNARSGFFGMVANWANGREGETSSAAARTRAGLLREQADERADISQDLARSTSPKDAFDLTSLDGAADGLKLLEESGRDSSTRLSALRAAFHDLGSDADQLGASLSGINLVRFGDELAVGMLGAVVEAAQGQADILAGQAEQNTSLFDVGRSDSSARDASRIAQDLAGDEQFATDLDAYVEQLLGASGGDISRDASVEMADAVAVWMRARLQEKYGELPQDFEQSVLNAAQLEVYNLTQNWREMEDPQASIDAYLRAATPEVASSARIDGLRAQAAGLGDAGSVELEARLKGLQDLRADVLSKGALPGQIEQNTIDILEVEQQLAEDLIGRAVRAGAGRQSFLAPTGQSALLEDQIRTLKEQISVQGQSPYDREERENELRDLERQLANQRRLDSSAARRAGIDSRDEVAVATDEAVAVYEELNQLEATGDTSSADYWNLRQRYAESLNAAAQAERERAKAFRLAATDPRATIARANIEIDALTAEINALPADSTERANLIDQRNEQRLARQTSIRQRDQARRRAGIDPRDEVANARADLMDAVGELNGQRFNTEEYWAAARRVSEARQTLADTELSRSQARRRSGIDPRSTLAQAAVAVQEARENLARSRSGSTAWWENLARLRSEQIALAEAEAQAASTARLLGSDITDPVARAAEEARLARELRQQAQGQGAPSDVVNDLLLGERESGFALDQARFQQWMSDLNTARDLNRISESAYISYLEERRQQLLAVNNRTRQQQDQLDAVDQALQAARAAIEGQFNIGDIRMPTPYEVRRAIAAQSAGLTPGAAAGGYTQVVNSTANTITINGADIGMVRTVLTDLLGPQAQGRATSGASGTRRL